MAKATVVKEEVKEVKAADKEAAKEIKFEVLSGFRDQADFAKEYKKGDDVSHFPAERLEFLIAQKLVKKNG